MLLVNSQSYCLNQSQPGMGYRDKGLQRQATMIPPWAVVLFC